MKRTPFLPGLDAVHVITMTIGILFGLSGFNHGLFEFLQGNTPTGGFLIHAIGEAQRFWPEGTEDAFTLIPNFMVSGILSMTVGLAAVIWSALFLKSRHGRKVFLGLFVLLFLVGGGIGQIAFFIPAWAFATRMDKPLSWWSRVLPPSVLPVLSAAWVPLLAVSVVSTLIGVEMAIFGLFPGVTETAHIQNTAMGFVFAAALLNIAVYVCGIGHELAKREAVHA